MHWVDFVRLNDGFVLVLMQSAPQTHLKRVLVFLDQPMGLVIRFERFSRKHLKKQNETGSIYSRFNQCFRQLMFFSPTNVDGWMDGAGKGEIIPSDVSEP